MKKLISIMLAVFLCVGMLAGCGEKSKPAEGGSTPAGDGGGPAEVQDATLVIAEGSQWWGADTVLLDGSSFTQGLVADPIISLDADGNMAPCIAEAVSISEDGLTITLTIPTDLKFHTGETLLPEDVKASLDRFKAVAPFASNLECIESISVEGQDVILKLREFTSDIAVSLSGSFITVQDKDVLDAHDDDFLLWGAKPYGLYYLDTYVEGSHVLLKRNEHYKTYNPLVQNKGPGYYSEITVRFIPEEFTMANALNLGDIQGSFSISTEGIAQLTRDDLEIKNFVSIPNIDYLEFNCDAPLLTDVRVRKAIALAIDREKLREVNNDLVIPSFTIITEGTPNKNDEAEVFFRDNYNTDIEASKALLAEAGWADSDGDGYLDKDGTKLELRIVANDSVIENNTVQSLQIQLKQVGIDLKIETYADYYHYDVIVEGNYDIGLEHFGWQEPVLLLQYVMCDTTNSDVCGITDEYYEVVGKIQHSVEYDTRTEYVGKAEELLRENWITVPLYSSMATMVFSDACSDILFTPNGAAFFNDLKAK